MRSLSFFASKNTSAIPYLPYINDIVKKAVLLDSYGVSKGKSVNSLLMHSLYAVADIGNGPEILKLYVEEINNPNASNTAKRAYQLQNIEKASAVNGGVQGHPPSSLASTTNAVRTVADLFAAVKNKDANFNPNPASKIVNADGTPMVLYHGTSDRFTQFKNTEISSLEGSFSFAQNREDAESYSGNGTVMEIYVSLKNPVDYNDMPAEIYRLKDKKAQVEALKQLGYDGWYCDIDTGWGEVSAFYPEQIKSATDNIGTFDGAKSSVDGAVIYLKKAANAKGDTGEFAAILKSFYEYIASEKELTWEGMKEQAQPAVQWLRDHVNLETSGTTALEFARDRDFIEQELLQQVYDSYWRVSTLHAVADVKQRQINRLKGEHIQRMEKVRREYQNRASAKPA